jgi:23S rRNA (cytosine1962-C5)-methyltransferase
VTPDLAGTEAQEGGLRFSVDPRHGGRDPLFFLDFRAARRRLRAEASGRSVLNLFSYTGTAGVAALAGGAREVLHVDFAASALEVAKSNAARNGYSESESAVLLADALLVTRQLAGLPIKGRGVHRGRRGGRMDHRAHRKPAASVTPRQYDVVVLDPPRWATSRFGAVDLVRDYQGVFKPALLATRPGGGMLVANNAAALKLEDWVGILERCAAKAGRPIRKTEVITPDDDFPSFDGSHPLKLAWLDV